MHVITMGHDRHEPPHLTRLSSLLVERTNPPEEEDLRPEERITHMPWHGVASSKQLTPFVKRLVLNTLHGFRMEVLR